MSQNQKTTFVVVDENVLGYIQPGMTNVGILASSIVRGAVHHWTDGCIAMPTAEHMRPATRQDFEDFRVASDGYENCPYCEFPQKV